MKELTDLEKRNILAPYIADQISDEALNENFNTISEILFYFNQREEYIINLLTKQRKAEYYDAILMKKIYKT